MLYAHTVLFADALMLAQQANLVTLPEWYHLLQDADSLIREPTKHHRELLHQAYALRDAHAVDAGDVGRDARAG